MTSLTNMTLTEFRTALTREQVRVGMIIQASLAGGALIFFFSIIAVSLIGPPKDLFEIDVEYLTIMTIVCGVFFLIAYSTGYFIYHLQFKPERLESAYSSDMLDKNSTEISVTPAQKVVSIIRTSMLIRTALLEGAAFFGLAVLMIAAQQGALNFVPWVWINALPLLVLLIWVIGTFPTSNRLEKIFETDILKR